MIKAQHEDLSQIIEALIFASTTPMSRDQLARYLEIDHDEASRQLTALMAKFDQSYGFELAIVGGGYQFRSREDYRDFIVRMYKKKPRPLANSLLEVVAIIGYKQPITKPEIEAIRGTDCGHQLKLLLAKGLITILGKKEDVGKPNLYGTTKEFLTFFALPNIRSLPSIPDADDLSDKASDQILESKELNMPFDVVLQPQTATDNSTTDVSDESKWVAENATNKKPAVTLPESTQPSTTSKTTHAYPQDRGYPEETRNTAAPTPAPSSETTKPDDKTNNSTTTSAGSTVYSPSVRNALEKATQASERFVKENDT